MAGLFPPVATGAYERRTGQTGDIAVEGVPGTLARAIASREGGDGSGELGGCAVLVLVDQWVSTQDSTFGFGVTVCVETLSTSSDPVVSHPDIPIVVSQSC